ncbi:MAG: beta-ketoacyl synthase [Pseudomonadales bacterium]|nr:beta-ketoacyl synthase [Pseudomonadales bacterium]
MRVVPPDAVSVYSGASICQLDEFSAQGLFQNPLRGQRISSKMLPFMFPEMSADFINSYMINSTGNTGANAGACATFLYNLRQAVADIQHGKARLAIVGSAEAPVIPEIVNGFNAMGALATEQGLKALDPSDIVAYHRACRPFSSNCGFTIAESAQFLILMDDELAIETGAQIFGAVPDVFINADGNKRSISSPGVGNYITVAKAVALARHLFGGAGLDQTYVHAHGTGTPQNRVSESHILNEVAKVFGIKSWLVTAIKAYVGHSLGPAAGDQIMAALGVWHDGLIPGIKTIDHIADDVCRSNLSILMDHHQAGLQGKDMLACIINAKGFGGNNASALLLSPNKTMALMASRYGGRQLAVYEGKRERVAELAEQYNQRAIKGERNIIYRFAECEMGPSDVILKEEGVNLSAFNLPIPLTPKSHYEDYLTRQS